MSIWKFFLLFVFQFPLIFIFFLFFSNVISENTYLDFFDMISRNFLRINFTIFAVDEDFKKFYGMFWWTYVLFSWIILSAARQVILGQRKNLILVLDQPKKSKQTIQKWMKSEEIRVFRLRFQHSICCQVVSTIINNICPAKSNICHRPTGNIFSVSPVNSYVCPRK